MRLINLTVPKETENPLTFLARKMVMRDSYVLIHKSILEGLISMGFQKTSTDTNTEVCYFNDKIGEFRIEGSFGCEYAFLNAVKPKTSKTYTVCNNSCELPDGIIFISSTRITVEDIYLEPGTDLIEELTEIKKEHKEGLMVMIQKSSVLEPNRFDMKFDSNILPRYHSQRKQTVLCKILDKRKKVIVYSDYSSIGSWSTISAVENDYKRIDIFNPSSKETLKCIKFIHVNKS